jgi:S1-C subfamily serine protease
MRRILATSLTLMLAGCAQSYGDRAEGFLNLQIAGAYIPLESITHLVFEDRAAAFVIEPGVAVTNAHNANVIGSASVIGESHNYDLLYFHVENNQAVPTSAPVEGENVIAYGQGASGELREARGTIKLLHATVAARCETCSPQTAFTIESNAGPGFSGGPVVDAATGKLVGITFGYLDPKGRRVMYAYPMSRVRNELATIEHKLPVDED